MIDLGKAAQWGIVVRDIEGAMDHYSRILGFGSFLHLRNIAPHEHQAVYNGAPSDVRITAAFGYFGETQIEIIQQLNDAPSPYKDFLAAGRSGIQHFGFWTNNYDETYADLVEAGYRPVYRAAMRGVPRETVYFSESDKLGAMLELSLSTPRKTALFGAMAERIEGLKSSCHVEHYDSMDELAKQLGLESWTAAN
jgi:hypothetical protein